MPVEQASAQSLGFRILAHSREAPWLERIRFEIPAEWDVTLALTLGATFEELRSRHFDFFITDEPALILVLHDAFPSADVRTRFAQIYFGNEYAYGEFLREYRERHHELSAIRSRAIPTVLLDRYADPARQQLYPKARSLASRTVPGPPAIRRAIESIVAELGRSG